MLIYVNNKNTWGGSKVRTIYQYQEQTLSIITKEKSPDLGILGGIEVEHVIDEVRDNTRIVTQVGGPGGKLALYLNDFFHLKPIIFDFISIDEYIDLIMKTFQMKKIQIVWLEKILGNKRKVRNLIENKEYVDERESEVKIEPEFLLQFLHNLKNVFVCYENWNQKFFDFINSENRKVFVHLDKQKINENTSTLHCDYLFLIAEHATNFKDLTVLLKNFKTSNNIIITHDAILFQDKVQEVRVMQKKYFEEAVSAFEAAFISCLTREATLKTAQESAFSLYNHVLENGSIPTEKI